ncbi:acyl-CoA N-acyltransferase [Lentinula aff. lateritia]|uniref:Acyl-CoA N-acyltransferase n=1 Tax=Lentinula aff. lateritia TaxID=2804960 RepID=A0ACC1UAN8_9AGAR|nr:acyl-CoA N-acyltransferase [Lentinula aff. lateritia]
MAQEDEEKSLSEGSETVIRANKKSAKQLRVALNYDCTFWLANELSESMRAKIWELINGNMSELCVNSSLGWNALDKQQELFDPLARYIIMHPVDKPDQIAGYSVLRFEHEAEEDILYCYELQISPLHQRKGLGKILMKLLEVIGRRTKMEKIMLTVLDNNSAAVDFYATVGFRLDECSPSFEDPEDEGNAEKVDYQILSKLLA